MNATVMKTPRSTSSIVVERTQFAWGVMSPYPRVEIVDQRRATKESVCECPDRVHEVHDDHVCGRSLGDLDLVEVILHPVPPSHEDEERNKWHGAFPTSNRCDGEHRHNDNEQRKEIVRQTARLHEEWMQRDQPHQRNEQGQRAILELLPWIGRNQSRMHSVNATASRDQRGARSGALRPSRAHDAQLPRQVARQRSQ